MTTPTPATTNPEGLTGTYDPATDELVTAALQAKAEVTGLRYDLYVSHEGDPADGDDTTVVAVSDSGTGEQQVIKLRPQVAVHLAKAIIAAVETGEEMYGEGRL